MFHRHWTRAAFWGAAALLASALALAGDMADSDRKEISGYVLTEAGLAKYTQALNNLGPLARRMSDDCGKGDGHESDGAHSLDGMVARVDAIPGVHAAIAAAGMTTREYLVFTLSLFQNGVTAWALDQPGGKLPQGVSMANVTFYRTHAAAIKNLGAETKDACDDDGDDRNGESSE
jgi:hypothetical protein